MYKLDSNTVSNVKAFVDNSTEGMWKMISNTLDSFFPEDRAGAAMWLIKGIEENILNEYEMLKDIDPAYIKNILPNIPATIFPVGNGRFITQYLYDTGANLAEDIYNAVGAVFNVADSMVFVYIAKSFARLVEKEKITE